MHIFQQHAPSYWAAGIPVMPLKAWNSISKGAGKAPILNEWTQYGEHMPSEAIRNLWLSSYPDANIGLPFGTASNLCAIDIDTEDQELVDVILAALPPSPWKRVGKKGMGLIYKWQGQPNFKLRDGDNQSIVEFLGKGNQMVMPPSIHPQTERPYVSDTNLWEVLDQIQPLPQDIERVLRAALTGVAGLSIAQTSRSAPLAVVPQGERDIQMVRHAGYLARVVFGIDKNQKFTLAEAMNHMRHWVENFTTHTAGGDDMDPEKGVSKLLEFLLKDLEAGKTMPSGWDGGLTDEQRAYGPIADMIKRNEVQRWTVTKAMAWLQANVAMKEDDQDWALEKLHELVAEIAKDDNFKDSDWKLQHARICQIMGMKMSKPDIANLLKEARRGDVEIAGDHESIAREVIEEMERGGELRHDKGLFWQWNGSCFSHRSDKDVYIEVASTVKGNPLVRRHGDYTSVVKTIEALTERPLGEELETGVNFANGFLDADLVLHPHSPKYGKTYTMPFNYVPERAGEAHKWLGYLEQSWGDDEDYSDKVLALQEAFAATMFGNATAFQCAFLLHGHASSGKTQALEVLKSMMPPSAQSSIPPTLWGERFQLAPMVNKTLNVCGELPEETTIDGRAFKEVIEGTEQNTEFKGGAIFGFKPIAAQWFASNFLPRSRDTSRGFTRRWLILDFNRTVPASERILNFHQVLVSEEREAIAAWGVLGLKRLLAQRGYTQPKSHLMRINQVTRANNSVAAFLQSSDKIRPVEDGSKFADARNVFDVYVDYMKTISRGWSVTYERFIQMIEELGHRPRDYVDGLGIVRSELSHLEIHGLTLPTRL